MTERNPAPGPAPAPGAGGGPAAGPGDGTGPGADGAAGEAEVPCPADHLQACTVRDVLDRVGGKWSIGIILAASRGPIRFTELERSVEGISRRMLTLTLRNLERDGLLLRTTYPTVPPRVEYVATEMALELYESLVALTKWAERHRQTIAAARAAYDHRRHAGRTGGASPDDPDSTPD